MLDMAECSKSHLPCDALTFILHIRPQALLVWVCVSHGLPSTMLRLGLVQLQIRHVPSCYASDPRCLNCLLLFTVGIIVLGSGRNL